ncbi:hypothetical protein N0V83_006310 [Neocucurbitaria cava]|uniref:Uncharacterized protein n=1 Tax=Neocucurbitaria cava TaxID=798079 RepID=A0A9W9CLV5_9PLEO|nr:hypothetical protein N0V83_006310 [Neocucurbitaria cava]
MAHPYEAGGPVAKDFADIVPQKQMKTMSDLDKEEEARIAKAHRQKAKNLGHVLCAWVVKLQAKKRSGV